MKKNDDSTNIDMTDKKNSMKTFSLKAFGSDTEIFKELAKDYNSQGEAFGAIISLAAENKRRKEIGTEAFQPLVDAWSANCNQQLKIISTAAGLYESAVIKAKESVQCEMERINTAYDARVAELKLISDELKKTTDELDVSNKSIEQLQQQIETLKAQISKREEDNAFLKKQLESANKSLSIIAKTVSNEQVDEENVSDANPNLVVDDKGDGTEMDPSMFEAEVSKNEN